MKQTVTDEEMEQLEQFLTQRVHTCRADAVVLACDALEVVKSRERTRIVSFLTDNRSEFIMSVLAGAANEQIIQIVDRLIHS